MAGQWHSAPPSRQARHAGKLASQQHSAGLLVVRGPAKRRLTNAGGAWLTNPGTTSRLLGHCVTSRIPVRIPSSHTEVRRRLGGYFSPVGPDTIRVEGAARRAFELWYNPGSDAFPLPKMASKYFYDTFKAAAETVMPVLSTSQFKDKGVLTPEEFVEAGDLLVLKCPTWSWCADAQCSAHAQGSHPPQLRILAVSFPPLRA